MRRVTLLTDFGTADGYVAAMKGILAAGAPGTFLDDVTHDIPPGDVEKGSRVLSRYWRLYPEGTVHLVVVDPGVGTGRRGVVAEADGRYFVAPDNGVLSRVLTEVREWRMVSLEASEKLPPPRSRTFHGRDLFAPAAVLIANGEDPDGLGPRVEDPVMLRDPRPRRREEGIEGEVVEVDRFGNLATNLPPEVFSEVALVVVAGREVRGRGTYGAAAEGELLALLDSRGRVEVAARNDSAARILEAGRGTPVFLPAPPDR